MIEVFDLIFFSRIVAATPILTSFEIVDSVTGRYLAGRAEGLRRSPDPTRHSRRVTLPLFGAEWQGHGRVYGGRQARPTFPPFWSNCSVTIRFSP
jgi:hypothetical protein